MIRHAHYESPIGRIIAVAADDAITDIDFVDAKYVARLPADSVEDPRHPVLRECVRELAEYFAGQRRLFELPLAPRGTDFQQRIWKGIARVPWGKTITYAELAESARAPGSARAAGAATGRNPIGIVVPCHRIVGADGSLTGYAGGLERKTKLLELEGVLQPSLA